MKKTTIDFSVEISYEGELDLDELRELCIEPIKQGIRTSCVVGPSNLKGYTPVSARLVGELE